jgi:hypothetical protein
VLISQGVRNLDKNFAVYDESAVRTGHSWTWRGGASGTSDLGLRKTFIKLVKVEFLEINFERE